MNMRILRRTRWLGVGLLATLAWAAGATVASAQGTQTITPGLTTQGGQGTQPGGGQQAARPTTTTGQQGAAGARTGTAGAASATIPSATHFLSTYFGRPDSAGYGLTLAPYNSLGSGQSGGGQGGQAGSGGFTSDFQLMQSLDATKGKVRFGSPLVNVATGTAAGGGGVAGTSLPGGLAGTNRAAGRTTTSSPYGFSTYGTLRTPQFITMPAEELKPEPFSSLVPEPPKMLALLRNTLDRSTSLKSPRNIQVTLDGGVIVLQGAVVTERERRLAEALIRLQPGIHDVRNELLVARPSQP